MFFGLPLFSIGILFTYVICKSIIVHPLIETFSTFLEECAKNSIQCELQAENISHICIRLANEHAQLLLHDNVRQLFQEAFFVLPPNSTIGNVISRITSVHLFSQGDSTEVSL